MDMDREFQKRLLSELAQMYPATVQPRNMGFEQNDPAFVGNALYLEEHGLLIANSSGEVSSTSPRIISLKITAKGLDFLEDDGGLTAILGVVTVRFEAETIKALLVDRVQKADQDPTVKDRMTNAIRELPAEATKRLSLRLLETSVRETPGMFEWLRGALGS